MNDKSSLACLLCLAAVVIKVRIAACAISSA